MVHASVHAFRVDPLDHAPPSLPLERTCLSRTAGPALWAEVAFRLSRGLSFHLREVVARDATVWEGSYIQFETFISYLIRNDTFVGRRVVEEGLRLHALAKFAMCPTVIDS